MAKSKKKLVRNFSVSALMMGAVLVSPTLEINLSAETTAVASKSDKEETWQFVDYIVKKTGSIEAGRATNDSWAKEKSNLGNTRTVRVSHEIYEFNDKKNMTYAEGWDYDKNGKTTKKYITRYDDNEKSLERKFYDWKIPGQGKPVLTVHEIYDNEKFDKIETKRNLDGEVISKQVVDKGYFKSGNGNKKTSYYIGEKLDRVLIENYKSNEHKSNEETYYDEYGKRVLTSKRYFSEKFLVKNVTKFYTNNLLTSQETNTYKDRNKNFSQTINYNNNGKVVKDKLETYYNSKEVKTKFVYNSFYSNGKKKVAQDTYYYENGTTKKSIKENQYNTKGVKTKYIINEFHTNGKKKLARDTYYYGNGKTVKEKRENLYNTSGVRTKNTYNSFHTNGKKKLARDTYYYDNGKTRKELKENHYNSKGKKTKSVLNQWYSNGKPKLYKDTYYKSNGKVKEVRQSKFSKTGKKTTTIKKY